MRPAVAVLVLTLALGLRLTASTTTVPPTGGPASVTVPEITLHVSPVAGLHFHVRMLLLSEGELPQAYVNVVAQAREYEAAIPGLRGWGFVEPLLAWCGKASELKDRAERLPERFRLLSGTIVEPRARSLRYAGALAEAEAAYLEGVWPTHEAAVASARDRLGAVLAGKSDKLLARVARRLEMKLDSRPLSVHLVAEAPPPGGSTSASRGIGIVSFVGVRGRSASELAEVVLHEAIHALDLRTRDQRTALNRLRRQLRNAGLEPGDRLVGDIPHIIVFLEASDAVRRLVDPEHRRFGPDSAFYAKAPEAAELVLPAWSAYLDGSASLDDTLAAIVTGVRQRNAR